MIGRGELDPRFMITHRFPLERAKEAFDMVADLKDGVIKAMIDIGPDGH
jgi:threonine dehydrogenase-like Zn-dependent dehydrogenase